MDKNKSRTDLLAAGRKKLEKFRQKKDNKGGNSKPSGKAGKIGKSGQDATADAATEAAVTPQNVADGEKSMHDAQDTVALSELHSRVDSVASNNAATAEEELSGKAVVILDTTSGSGVNETRMNESTGDGCGVDTELLEKGGFSSLVPEDAKYNVPGTPYLFGPGENSPDSGTPLLIPEVGYSTRNQIDGGMVAQIEGDNSLSPNEFAESAENATLVIAQLGERDDTSRTVVANNDTEEAQESKDHSVGTFPLTESEIVSDVRSEVSVQQGEGLSSGLLDEEKTEMLNVFGGYRGHIGAQLSPDVIEERSFEFKIDGMEKSIGCTVVDLSSGLDGGLIKLSRLAEILQILDEDEFKFLFMSREISPEKLRDANAMTIHQSAVHDAFERLKEELYVASFARDAFHLQLSEHQKLIEEISMANVSLNDVQGKNEALAEEIGQCRCELLEVATERERLDKNLHLAKSQVEEFSAKVNELQYKLETSQGDISNLSLELVHCQNLVAALQAENENSNGRFKLMAEEEKKILEKNCNILLENNNMMGQLAECKVHLETLQMENVNLVENVALLRDDMRQLKEENDCIVHEKNNLLADLADYKSTVEALKSESKISNEIFKSVSEERKNLEEEKELVVHQTVKLSKELTDCKDLVVTLQTEISNIHGALTSAKEEKNKYEEEKNGIFSEYEKQWHELAEIKVFEASLRAEYRKAAGDLKEAALRINQLTEENEILKINMEFHKSSTRESDQKKCSPPFVEVSNRSVESEILILQKPNSERHADRSFLENLKSDVYDDSSGFVTLKKHLVDAGVVMQKLEKAIEGMHLHVASFSKSSDKVTAPGVSRLIQAFESRNHNDDHDLEESSSSENQTTGDMTGDPFTMSQIVIQNLRSLLDELVLDAESASEFCMGMKQSKLCSGTELRSDYDSLRKHTDLVEEANIELMVLYEVIRERLCYAVAKEGDLLILCDALQKQELILKLENNHLREKLNDFQAKSSELQSKLDEIYKDSDEIVASIFNQLRILQTEMADRETIIEEEWNSVIAQVLQTIVKLDATIETSHSTPLTAANSDLDIVSRVSYSVFGATKVIEGLYEQLEAAKSDRQAVSDAYDDLHEDCSNLQGKNEMAIKTLCKLYKDLSELVSHETENDVVDDKVLDLLHPDFFSTLLDHLKIFLSERLQLEYSNKQLDSELMISARKIDELEKKCLKSDTIIKLAEDIEQSVQPQGKEIYADEPASRLESLIYLLLKKYKEADQGLSFSTSLEAKLSDLKEQVEDLNLNLVQYENENIVFKESLKTAEEDVVALNSKVREKVAELEQSEQRVSSLREKLGIAVTKGKGLISQRDSLKQSLSEMSKELARCSQELLSKDATVHDLETKLNVYSEAGERMEALESELSYIRNSATALRESFILKDSILQRIEEILEDLELSEHFHSSDIIEKIDWLAKSVTGNPLHLGNWDQKNSIGGGSHSDAGFVSVDGLKENMQPNSSSSDDLRRRYEELQSKFYELAEQNDMLEQSLMERNYLVQQWEESLDRVDMPSQLRSMEPEDKIQWFEKTLTESSNQCHSLQEKINNLEGFCGSLTADMEDSQRKLSELDAAFQQACREREILSKELESLSHDNTEISKKASDFKIRNDNLQNEVNMLLEQKLQIEEDFLRTESVMRRLQNLVEDALQDSNADDLPCSLEDVKYFEELLRKLIEKYRTICSDKPINTENIDVHVTEKGEALHISRSTDEQEMLMLSKKLEDLMGELVCYKDEKDRYMLNNQSLIREVEDLERNKNELRELLNQEEHKSASLREKLNVAVRKGKSLVQQRDGMKQVIEELNAEVEHLKSDIKHTENAISEYEERIKELSTTQERAQVMESENSSLRDRLVETEHHLQVKEDSLSNVLDALNNVDIGLAINFVNPIEKLKEMGNYIHDLRIALNSAEQESKKSKRAAELLLAELNEVQERSDVLQEELAKAADELSELSKEKDSAEAAKYEALARVEKLSSIHSEERDRQLSEFMVLKSGVDQLGKDLFAFGSELGNVLSKDREVLHNIEIMMQSFLELGDSPDLSALFPGGTTEDIILRKSENKIFLTEIGSLNEQLYKHSHLLREEIFHLSDVVRNVHREFAAQKESNETIKRDVKQLESNEKDKESELCSLRESISLLYGACASAIFEIENWRDLAVGNALASRVTERNLTSQISIEGGYRIAGDVHIFTGEGIRFMHDKLLSVVKDCISMQHEIKEVVQREMKSTIMDLQKELQEKDIQRERICMELVNQIKEAETNAKNYLQDLQQARVHLLDLQSQFDAKEADFKVLKQRMKELQDHETNSLDLQQKVKSLTVALAAKEQETESLMQALDEEETQMEDLANKIGGLEIELQQKNQDLENLEASRTKALKKLSVTVSKFDELHYLSESLLSEVEKLQSQLQDRDEEISFLRQEVTRCTNDALTVTQMSKKSSDEIHDLLTWLETLISRAKVHDVTFDSVKNYQVNEYKEVLKKQIMALVSELDNFRLVAQNSDVLLQEERSKVEELAKKQQYLENSLRDKESEIVMLQGADNSAKATNNTLEIVEVEPITNKRSSPGTIAPQVRSLRKTNNDQIAIAIDVDHSTDRFEEDDDDKAHGFKSLTTSKIVPRFTRPVSDMIDGLWVSCDRALMRRPVLRLGVIFYWAVLHALLATFVV